MLLIPKYDKIIIVSNTFAPMEFTGGTTMTENILRNVLKEAKQKGQIGLFIWANWTVWDNMLSEVKPGNGSYDFAFSKISKGEAATVPTDWNGLSMPGFIAVSVQELNASDDYFKKILNLCIKYHYHGPISLVPLNKISSFF